MVFFSFLVWGLPGPDRSEAPPKTVGMSGRSWRTRGAVSPCASGSRLLHLVRGLESRFPTWENSFSREGREAAPGAQVVALDPRLPCANTSRAAAMTRSLWPGDTGGRRNHIDFASLTRDA